MKLFFRTYGEGQPLVILHGLLGMSDNWIQPAKSLADSFQVFLPDIRNHGLSPHDDLHNYDVISSDLKSFFEAHALSDLVLAGHSMGGKAAMCFADKYPEFIRKLIIIDISPLSYKKRNISKMRANHFELLSFIKGLNISELKSRQAISELVSEKFSDEFLIQLLHKNIQKTAKGFSWKINADAILNNLDEIGKELQLSSEVSKINTLFVFGKDSPFFTEDDYFSAKKHFPDAKITVIKDAGHNIHIDKKDELLDIIKRFIDSSN